MVHGSLGSAGAFLGHRLAKSAGHVGLKELFRMKLEAGKIFLGWKYLWPKLRHFIFSCQMLHMISYLSSSQLVNDGGGSARWILESFGELDFTILSMRRFAQCIYSEESFYALYWLTMLQACGLNGLKRFKAIAMPRHI